MTPKPRILFVDDERRILDALRDRLRRQRRRWDMVFALEADEAFDALARGPFDVVVSDMRMPAMDGVALLERVRAEHPHTLRAILSGHAERSAVIRAIAVAHRFLSKPCDVERLRALVATVDVGAPGPAGSRVRAVAGAVDHLPVDPTVRAAFAEVIAAPGHATGALTETVRRDPALAAKVLQLVNSAFFGLPQRTASIERAVAYLGADVLGAVLEGSAAFRSDDDAADAAMRGEIRRVAWWTAQLARTIAERDGAGDAAFTAGLLHDVGGLLAPEDAAEERAAMSGTLLGMWGLPPALVEAVTHHRDPAAAAEEVTAWAFAVGLARRLLGEVAPEVGAGPEWPAALIESRATTDEIVAWRASARALVESGVT